MSEGQDASRELAERLRRPRPPSSIAQALLAAAGVLGAAGALTAVSEAGGQAAVNVVAVLVLVASYAIALSFPWARAAALAGGVIAPLVLADGLAEQLDGRAAVVVPALLVGGGWLVMLLSKGLRGAPVLVAGVLLAGWVALTGLTEPTGVSGEAFIDVPGNSVTASPVDVDPFGTDDVSVRPDGAVALVCALGLACAAAVQDRRGWHVLATPFIAVAVFLAVVGLVETSLAGAGDSVLLLAVGAVLAAVGASGLRRGSTWIGVGLGAVGLVALLAHLAGDPSGLGLLLVLAGGGVALVARPIEDAFDPVPHDRRPSVPEAF